MFQNAQAVNVGLFSLNETLENAAAFDIIICCSTGWRREVAPFDLNRPSAVVLLTLDKFKLLN